jgi:hypothetical protein
MPGYDTRLMVDGLSRREAASNFSVPISPSIFSKTWAAVIST